MFYLCTFKAFSFSSIEFTSFHSLFTLSFHSSVHISLHSWTLPKRAIFVDPSGGHSFFSHSELVEHFISRSGEPAFQVFKAAWTCGKDVTCHGGSREQVEACMRGECLEQVWRIDGGETCEGFFKHVREWKEKRDMRGEAKKKEKKSERKRREAEQRTKKRKEARVLLILE